MKWEGDQSAFKREIKLWLKSHGLDYKWIANQCGVSEITVRNWMSQKSIPPLKLQLIERVMEQLPVLLPTAPSPSQDVQVDATFTLTIRLSPSLYTRLEARAAQCGMPMGDFVGKAIARLVEEGEEAMDSLKTRKVILPSAD